MIQEVLPSSLMKNPTDKLRSKCLLNTRVPSLCLDLLVLGLGVREWDFFLWGAEWRGREKKKKNIVTGNSAICDHTCSNVGDGNSAISDYTCINVGAAREWPSRFVLTKSGKVKALFYPTLWYQQINYIWNFFSTCWAGPWSVQRPPNAHSGL